MKKALVISILFILSYFIIGIAIKRFFSELFLNRAEIDIAYLNNLFIYKYILLSFLGLIQTTILWLALLRSKTIQKSYIIYFCLPAFIIIAVIERFYL
jgi:hypothetical protein